MNLKKKKNAVVTAFAALARLSWVTEQFFGFWKKKLIKDVEGNYSLIFTPPVTIKTKQ